MTPPPSPTTIPRYPSRETRRSCPVRIAPRRSRLSRAAISRVNAFSFARPVPGVITATSEATKAMISITAITSISVKPDFRLVLHIRDVSGGAFATFTAIGPVGHDLIGRALHGRAVLIGMAPRIGRYFASLDVGAVPNLGASRPLRQGIETLRRRRVTTGVQIKQVECRTEALDLQLGGLGPRFAQIVQHPRPDEP